MKIYKKIFIGFIVIVTIFGLVAFSFPVRNFSKPQPQSSSPKIEENYAASPAPVAPAPASSTSTSEKKASFKEMSGFSDLNKESNFLKEMGTNGNASSVEDIFKELNQ